VRPHNNVIALTAFYYLIQKIYYPINVGIFAKVLSKTYKYLAIKQNEQSVLTILSHHRNDRTT